MSRGFELVIKCSLPENIDVNLSNTNSGTTERKTEKTRYRDIILHLDTISERDLTASAKIASQPIFNGDTLSDHMYRDPDTYSISGSFSVYGYERNTMDSYAYVPGTNENGDRLENIQKTFEYIKDNGILCDLMTYIEGEKGATRFKVRPQMALESITWKESESSMAYSFSFKEIISLNYDLSDINIEIAEDNEASLASPVAQNLGDILFGKMVSEEDVLSFWDKVILNTLCQSHTFINRSTVVAATLFAEQIQTDSSIYYKTQDKSYSAILTQIAKNDPLYLEEYIKAALKRAGLDTAGNIGSSAIMGVIGGTMAGLAAASVITSVGALATYLGVAGTTAAASSSAGPIGLIVGIAVGICILVTGIIITAVRQEQKRFKIIDGLKNWLEPGNRISDNEWAKIARKYNITVDYGYTSSGSGGYGYILDDTKKQEIFLAMSKDTTKLNYNELGRLKTFLNECNITLNQVANNCRFYQLPDMSETPSTECQINIGGNAYKLTFTKKYKYETVKYLSKDKVWKEQQFKIEYLECAPQIYNTTGNTWDNLDGSNGSLRNAYDRTLTCTSLDSVTSDEAIFVDKTGTYEIHLYNPALEADVLSVTIQNYMETWSDTTNDLLSKTTLSYTSSIIEASNINNCMLIVSYGSFETVKNNLKDTISKYVSRLEA